METQLHRKHKRRLSCADCHGKKILIVTDSKHGSTSAYSDKLGPALCSKGFQVDVGRAHKMLTTDISGYDGYIIGSPTYWGFPLKDLRKFLEINSAKFAQKPTAYLYNSLEGAETGNESAKAFLQFAYHPVLRNYPTIFPIAPYLQSQVPPNGTCDLSFNSASGMPRYTISPGTVLRPQGSLSTFTAQKPDGTVLPSSVVSSNPGTPADLIAGTGVPGTLFGLAFQTNSFAALLGFLETQGELQVLSNPRIATLNNQKAVLKVGTDEFFVTNVTSNQTTTVGGAIQTSPTITVQPFFSGVALDVTPQIEADSQVILHLHPSVSRVTTRRKTSTWASPACSACRSPRAMCARPTPSCG